MRWTTEPDDARIPDHLAGDPRAAVLRPPATGAWRDGDPVAGRKFAFLGEFGFEQGGAIPVLRLAYETWGELSPQRDNAILICHALTGDAHVEGDAGPGQPTAGWWPGLIGPGRPLDTDRWFVVASNMLGGCQGSSGPASLDRRGREYGASWPPTTIRDQVAAQAKLADHLGIERFAAVIGGSMGGMHALEWAISRPERVARLAVLAAPPVLDARNIAENTLQADAIRLDPAWQDGDYYDEPTGGGPWRGLALARRLAMLNYRSHSELEDRFGRSWQSSRSPAVDDGRYSVESYLDFHGNRFTRRFDANSYIALVEAMSSHDVGRGRGDVDTALASIACPTLALGVTTDLLFPLETQHRIARAVPASITGDEAMTLDSPFGHDGFLIEIADVGEAIERLLAVDAA